MKKLDTRSITALGLLVAVEIVLSRFCSINAWDLKIGFSFLPVAVAAMRLGPLEAAVVAAVSDFVGAVLFPIGAYFPGFTLTAFLSGLVFGWLLHRRRTAGRVLAPPAGAGPAHQLVLDLRPVQRTLCPAAGDPGPAVRGPRAGGVPDNRHPG